MELSDLVEALSRPGAYPHPVEDVQVRHTHISVVFLAGPYAYKVRKPVKLDFLDFSTLEKRRHDCREEVRLNRRLAPSVYLGTVPITCNGKDVGVGGQGEVVEWAVQMARLPDDATLEQRLEHGQVGPEQIAALARRVASFHLAAGDAGARGSFGNFSTVARNARENFSQSAGQVGVTVSPTVHQRLARLTDEHLARLQPLIEARSARGVPRDTHGDLRLEHVYLFRDLPAPADLVIVDCVEFNEGFRFADPVADAAFLVMDLAFHGRRDLANAFADAYFQVTGDEEGRPLLPFYTAYRAAVRAKVEGLELSEKEVPEVERAIALERARAHWLLALGELDQPGRRPCLVLVAGLPGSGKSTLARSLAEHAGFEVIRSDMVRKELAGSAALSIYSPEWGARTYTECLRQTEVLLFEGKRVLVDANFRREAQRRLYLDAAARWRVPALVLLCRASPDVAQRRLAGRRGDISDADWRVYLELTQEWEEPGEQTGAFCRELSTDGPLEQTLARALEALDALVC